MNDDELQELEKAPQTDGVKALTEKLTLINCRQLETSTNYKRERMGKIKKFEELYQGKVPRKFRQLFNVNFPVFTGFVDTLESDFSDPITALFKEQDASDYFKVKKIQAAWDRERLSLTPSGMWDLKVRLDRKNAIMSGRGIERYYASSEPRYETHFDVVNYNYFHCQPTGGTHLENHLFAGEEMVLKTKRELLDGADAGIYDKESVRQLIARQGNQDFIKDLGDEVAAKFRALGLDPNGNNYVGEATYALCQWVSTYGGRRWYNLFDPLTKLSIRFDRLKEIYSGEYFPWTTWATHEDQQVFWTVGYGDFFYPVADAMITLLNQELTNREKSNYSARAYDEEMFSDEQKLDQAQYRQDALVPANTMGGTKRIGEGIYRFDTPQLQGTIDLAEWIDRKVGNWTAVSEMQMGAAPKAGTKAYVQFMQQQQLAKRLSFKAQSYQECYQQIALRFIQGLKDHMPASMAVKMVGPEGYDHWEQITKLDLNLHKTPHIEIQSTTAQEQANKIKTEEKVAALTAIAGSPHVNEKVRIEYVLRQGGHFDDMDVAMLMDTSSSTDKDVQAKAAIAIKDIMEKREPELNYSADLNFLKIIQKFVVDHLVMVKKKGLLDDFKAYIEKQAPIAQDNMKRLAAKMKAEQAMHPPAPPAAPPKPAAKPSAKGKAMPSPVRATAPSMVQ